MNVIISKKTQHPFVSMDLFSQRKNQSSKEFFSDFIYDGKNGETYLTPFEALAKMAQSEQWDFSDSPGKLDILRNYLNYTFKRVKQEGKIAYNSSGTQACFNTGLLNSAGNDIYALFKKYIYKSQDRPEWYSLGFIDRFSLKGFQKPAPAKYYDDENAPELKFITSYEVVVDFEHIYDEDDTRKNRLPEQIRNDRTLALNTLYGALHLVRINAKRDYSIAVPHWYQNHIQLLLPLYLTDSEDNKVALVLDADHDEKLYRGITILTMKEAYLDARIIRRPIQSWLRP